MKKDTVNNRLSAMDRDMDKAMREVKSALVTMSALWERRQGKLQKQSAFAVELCEYMRLPWRKRLFTKRPR